MKTRGAQVVFAIVPTILATAALAPAQKIISAKSGLVYFVQGRAWVDYGQLKFGENKRQLLTGETLYTERGRAEVLLNPGAVLRLGDFSRLRMDDTRLTDSCATLLSGAAVITVKPTKVQDVVRLRVGSTGVVVLSHPGVYRFDGGKTHVDQARLRVYDGVAEAHRSEESAAIKVTRGKSIEFQGLEVAQFDTKQTDALERWANARSYSPPPRGLPLVPPRLSRPKSTASSNSVEAAQRAVGLGPRPEPGEPDDPNTPGR